MPRTCPFLLGALLIALICLGGGLEHLDRLLGPTMAWFAGLLPLGLAPSRPAGGALIIASRELAPIAALLCLGLGPLFGRWSWLAGGLLLAGSSSAVFLATAVAGHAGILVAPGAPLSAVLLALAIGALSRLEAAAGNRGAPAPAEAGMAALMPSLAEHSTAPILVFDSDGGIRACNRALGEMFGTPRATW